MFLAPATCSAASEFLQAPAREGQKLCRTATRSETRLQKYTTSVRRKGRRVRVTKTRSVVVEVPVYDLCATYGQRIDSLMTVAHESMHVLGIGDEAVAECFALQTLTPVAAHFGAKTSFAYEIGRDYLEIYAGNEQHAPDYWSPDCRDGGALDVFPRAAGWPTPPLTREQLLPRVRAARH